MSETNGVDKKVLRKRDILMIGIVGLSIYISLENNSFDYRIDPAWFFDQRKLLSSSAFKQIAPIVTDIDGDGMNEVVLITKDLTLKILSATLPSGQVREEIYSPREIASVKLSSFKIVKGSIPVGLRTGYIDRYDNQKVRGQVIVVVREDWTVLCFNSKLQKLWEKSIEHKIHSHLELIDQYEIIDLSILITPLTVRESEDNTTQSTSHGMVVVGASMGLRTTIKSPIQVEKGLDDGNVTTTSSNTTESTESELREGLEHYTVYAMDGHDGTLIWKHDGTEIRAEQFSRSLPKHSYRLDSEELARQVHHGLGVNDCTAFRQSLLGEMPHSWRHRADGKSRFAHFIRRHLGIGAGHQIPRSKSAGKTAGRAEKKVNKRPGGNVVGGHGRFTGIEAPPLVDNAILPHHASEHLHNPNVLVAHTRRGIEVLAIRTGLPLTALALAPGNTYADVDGDGVVDTVMVLETQEDVNSHGKAFAHENGELQRCSVMVVSGFPPHTQLFNGTVCPRRVSLHDPILRNRITPLKQSAATPLVLQSTASPSSRNAHVADIVVAINSGIVSCYTGRGQFRWQVTNAPIWEPQEGLSSSPVHAGVAPFDWDAARVADLGTHDSKFSQIVAYGDDSVTLISREGAVMAVLDLIKKPTTRPAFGDFDGDGIVDIIVTTADATYGYRLEVTASARGLLIAFMVLIALAVIVFVSNVRTESTDNRVGKQKNVFYIVRSTDEWHID